MYLIRVQTAVTHQFSGEKQHRNLVAVADSGGGIRIDVQHIDVEGGACEASLLLQGRQFQ